MCLFLASPCLYLSLPASALVLSTLYISLLSCLPFTLALYLPLLCCCLCSPHGVLNPLPVVLCPLPVHCEQFLVSLCIISAPCMMNLNIFWNDICMHAIPNMHLLVLYTGGWRMFCCHIHAATVLNKYFLLIHLHVYSCYGRSQSTKLC